MVLDIGKHRSHESCAIPLARFKVRHDLCELYVVHMLIVANCLPETLSAYCISPSVILSIAVMNPDFRNYIDRL